MEKYRWRSFIIFEDFVETLKSQKCVLNSVRFWDTPHLPLP